MENFLRFNAPMKLRDVQKPERKQITFTEKRQSSLSVPSRIYPQDPFASKTSSKLVEPSLKFELCEQELFRMENEIKKNRSRSDNEMIVLTVEIQEAEISAK